MDNSKELNDLERKAFGSFDMKDIKIQDTTDPDVAKWTSYKISAKLDGNTPMSRVFELLEVGMEIKVNGRLLTLGKKTVRIHPLDLGEILMRDKNGVVEIRKDETGNGVYEVVDGDTVYIQDTTVARTLKGFQ